MTSRKRKFRREMWALIGNGLPFLSYRRNVVEKYLPMLNGHRITRVLITELKPKRGSRGK